MSNSWLNQRYSNKPVAPSLAENANLVARTWAKFNISPLADKSNYSQEIFVFKR